MKRFIKASKEQYKFNITSKDGLILYIRNLKDDKLYLKKYTFDLEKTFKGPIEFPIMEKGKNNYLLWYSAGFYDTFDDAYTELTDLVADDTKELQKNCNALIDFMKEGK